MIIDTRWNLGDKVWGVVWRCYSRETECPACNGQGGANVPGTGVFARCQDCDGTGKLERDVNEYYVSEHPIGSIDARVDYKGTKIRYGYSIYIHHDTFLAVADSRDEALAEAKRLAEADEDGLFKE
jgi:hypothetical protein